MVNNNGAESSSRALSIPAFVNVEYKVGKQIGEGSFGIIFEGVNLFSQLQVAIKFESRKAEAPQLRDEFRAYRLLSCCDGIPNAYYFGQDGLHNMLIIDKLGQSLESLFNRCNRKFTVKTVCMLAKQMITRVSVVHEKSLVYRDIKPDNFITGREGTKDENKIFMIDFGMAKFYCDPLSKKHIPYRERKCLSGTARYMSINTHQGKEQSRRDDLEALGYVFFYFLRGSLPWQNLKARTNRQKYEMIGDTKSSTPIEKLCENYPEEFAEYLRYVKDLAFEKDPDYDYLLSLVEKCMKRHNIVDDGIFDWHLIPKKGAALGNATTTQPTGPTQGTGHLMQAFSQNPNPGGALTQGELGPGFITQNGLDGEGAIPVRNSQSCASPLRNLASNNVLKQSSGQNAQHRNTIAGSVDPSATTQNQLYGARTHNSKRPMSSALRPQGQIPGATDKNGFGTGATSSPNGGRHPGKSSAAGAGSSSAGPCATQKAYQQGGGSKGNVGGIGAGCENVVGQQQSQQQQQQGRPGRLKNKVSSFFRTVFCCGSHQNNSNDCGNA